MNKLAIFGIILLLSIVTSTGFVSAALSDNSTMYFKMNESSGSTVYDATPNAYNCIVQGSVPIVSGIIDNARNFTGSLSNYLQCTNNAVKNYVGQNFTINAWIKTSQVTTGDIVNDADPNSPYNGWELQISGDSGYAGQIKFYSDSAHAGYSTITVNNKSWNMVTVTVIGLNASIYINGVYNNWFTTSGQQNNSINMTIGGRSGVYNAFNGTIDEVGLWSRGLSSSEISQLYNSGSPGAAQQYPFPQDSISGNISYNGVAFANASVQLMNSSGSFLAQNLSNSSGGYSFSGLSNASLYKVFAWFDNSTSDVSKNYFKVGEVYTTQSSNTLNLDFYQNATVSSVKTCQFSGSGISLSTITGCN